MFGAEESTKQRRQRAEKLIEIYYKHVSELAVVSLAPLIFYIPIDANVRGLADNYKFLFDSLKHQKMYILCCTYWNLEKPKYVDKLKALIDEYKSSYPNFTFVFLSNTPNQNQLFNSKNLDSIFCNHNCIVDERLFFPMPGVEKQFDAVYDARLAEGKRHELAIEIESLGLIYHKAPVLEDNLFIEKIKRDFAFAKFFNHSAAGEYKTLSPQEVNRSINACRVGLCLSEEEGAMFASIQYLLAGLPVVTTPSVGGRDVFFDEEISITIEPTPDAVKAGVEEMIKRNLRPEFIRHRTVERMIEHRDRFIALVQNIYDKEKVKRSFTEDFYKTFSNKLIKRVHHQSIVQFLLSLEA